MPAGEFPGTFFIGRNHRLGSSGLDRRSGISYFDFPAVGHVSPSRLLSCSEFRDPGRVIPAGIAAEIAELYPSLPIFNRNLVYGVLCY